MSEGTFLVWMVICTTGGTIIGFVAHADWVRRQREWQAKAEAEASQQASPSDSLSRMEGVYE